MSQQENIQLHRAVISETKQRYPIGHNKRLELINRAIHGILRAKAPSYTPIYN